MNNCLHYMLQIWEVIRNDISQPDGQNELRKQQLMQLAQLNGTFRQPDSLMCVYRSLFKSSLASLFLGLDAVVT